MRFDKIAARFHCALATVSVVETTCDEISVIYAAHAALPSEVH
ncbi:hypothetical protein [Clostridium sp. AN503]